LGSDVVVVVVVAAVAATMMTTKYCNGVVRISGLGPPAHSLTDPGSRNMILDTRKDATAWQPAKSQRSTSSQELVILRPTGTDDSTGTTRYWRFNMRLLERPELKMET
jgi:hypothetical protein